MTILLALAICLLVNSSASAKGALPSKVYNFAELIFDSEVKRPSGDHFNAKDKVAFKRLSTITPPSFIRPLIESSGERVLGTSVRSLKSITPLAGALERWPFVPTRWSIRMAPRA